MVLYSLASLKMKKKDTKKQFFIIKKIVFRNNLWTNTRINVRVVRTLARKGVISIKKAEGIP